jgi:hypothetical protein
VIVGADVWGGFAYFLLYALLCATFIGAGIPLYWMMVKRRQPIAALGITTMLINTPARNHERRRRPFALPGGGRRRRLLPEGMQFVRARQAELRSKPFARPALDQSPAAANPRGICGKYTTPGQGCTQTKPGRSV